MFTEALQQPRDRDLGGLGRTGRPDPPGPARPGWPDLAGPRPRATARPPDRR